MAVRIDSGELPMLHEIDLDKQPERDRVLTAWIRAFNEQTLQGVSRLREVLADIDAYPWVIAEDMMRTPEDFAERIGILALADAESRDIIESWLKEAPKRKRALRLQQASELHAKGMSQRQIAEALGVSHQTIGRDVVVQKTSVHSKDGPPEEKPKRKVVQYKISQYTKPETAARRIREVFGDEYALALGSLLVDA